MQNEDLKNKLINKSDSCNTFCMFQKKKSVLNVIYNVVGIALAFAFIGGAASLPREYDL